MSMETIYSTEDEQTEERRRIKGKFYHKFKIEAINREAAQFNCPFLIRQSTLYNTIHDARVPLIGMNALRDNDLVLSKFEQCIGCDCMAFDPETITCLRCK